MSRRNGTSAPVPERACRFCGCTETRACMTPTGPCAWVPTDDVCTAPACLIKLREEAQSKP